MDAEGYSQLIDDTKEWLSEIVPHIHNEEAVYAIDRHRDLVDDRPVRMIEQTKFIKTIDQQMYTRDVTKRWHCTNYLKRMLVRDVDGEISDITWPFGHLDPFLDANTISD